MLSAIATIAEPFGAAPGYGATRAEATELRDVRGVARLWVDGDCSLLRRPSVAVIGSRVASKVGLAMAAELAKSLVREHIVVMSGLARGIDAAAHCSAIANGGRTIAVIGTPLERAYPPEHAALQDRIRRDHLLASPFPAGTRTTRAHFPIRNRVMARLADVTVVVEAGDDSGAMHQIEECLRAGRPVFVAGWLLGRTELTWPRNVLERRGVFVWRHTSDIVDAIIR